MLPTDVMKMNINRPFNNDEKAIKLTCNDKFGRLMKRKRRKEFNLNV